MFHLLYQDDSSVFRAKIREEDLKPEEALQNIQDKLDELARNQLLEEAQELDKAQKLEESRSVEEEICKKTHEEFASLLDEVELFAEANNTLNPLEELLKRICSVLEHTFEYLAKPLTIARKEGWLFSLLRKFLSQRLSWEEMLDNEIAELREKLENDDLSAEERAEIMQRLKVLQEIKLHKITAIGLIIGIIASFIGFGAAVARSGEIVKDAIAKLSQAQEAEQKECEKETANHKAEDKAKEKEQEEENKRKCSELSASIFKALSDKRLPSESVIDALMPTMVLLYNMGHMATGIVGTGKHESTKESEITKKHSSDSNKGKNENNQKKNYDDQVVKKDSKRKYVSSKKEDAVRGTDKDDIKNEISKNPSRKARERFDNIGCKSRSDSMKKLLQSKETKPSGYLGIENVQSFSSQKGVSISK